MDWENHYYKNNYSHNLHHYYKITVICDLKPNYTILVLYNILEHPVYRLVVVVPPGS